MLTVELTPAASKIVEEYTKPPSAASDTNIEFLKNYAYFLVKVCFVTDFTDIPMDEFDSLNTQGLFELYNLLVNDGPSSFSAKIDQNYALNFLHQFDSSFQRLMGVRPC